MKLIILYRTVSVSNVINKHGSFVFVSGDEYVFYSLLWTSLSFKNVPDEEIICQRLYVPSHQAKYQENNLYLLIQVSTQKASYIKSTRNQQATQISLTDQCKHGQC